METHVKIAGALMIALSLMHVVLPKYFKWKDELTSLSLITRQILYVHTFFIAFVVLLMGLLCVSFPYDLVRSRLGHAITLGLFVFWFTRLIFQFLVYSSKTWRGKKFETIMHVVFTAVWLYFSIVFLLCQLQYTVVLIP